MKWETLKQAAERTGRSYQTFKNWKSQKKLPFPVYGSDPSLVKPHEVDAWLESQKLDGSCYESVERATL